jgi:hypothetical protein
MNRLTPRFTRREILKSAALGAVALPLVGTALRAAAAPAEAAAKEGRERGLRLGVATYSTRDLSLDDTIATLKTLRIVNAGVFRAHCNWETATPDECRAVAARSRAPGWSTSAPTRRNVARPSRT